MLEASHREDMGYGERRPRPALGRTGQPHEAGHDDRLLGGGRDPERRRVAGCRMPLFELLTYPVRR